MRPPGSVDHELVGQVHSIKRRVLPSGKVSFDAERSTRGGHADRVAGQNWEKNAQMALPAKGAGSCTPSKGHHMTG